MNGYNINDTIAAIATPTGAGALGILRLSGTRAFDIIGKVFSGTDLSSQAANTIHFGKISKEGRILDEVLVSIFRNPKSYTGEDLIEISCHGSPYIQQEVLKALVEAGARTASEGEFTFRAFINGKLDLSQAEAVADLIAADSKVSADLALQQLRGGYSNKLKAIREELIHFASMLELELDFSEEDVAFANRDDLLALITELRKTLHQMIASFDQGNVLKNGLPVAIIGPPNAGKSTLLNSILQEEKAIVSEIPGTTRDAIEDTVSIGGLLFRFIDTAGIRDTEDAIESIGIQRARDKATNARVVICLMDATELNRDKFDQLKSYLTNIEGKTYAYVVNKVDKLSEGELTALRQELNGEKVYYISAREGEGTDEMMEGIVGTVMPQISEGEGIIVSNVRHLDALKACDKMLETTVQGINENRSTELIAMDVRQALYHLGLITGEVSTDDLLGNIFSRFCIGK